MQKLTTYKCWVVRLGNVFLNTLLVHPIREVITRTHLVTLATGIDGALFSRVRNPIVGVVEVLALSLGTKTLPPVPEILGEKEKVSP